MSIDIVLIWIFYKVHRKTRHSSSNLIVRIIVDLIVVSYSLLLLIYITRSFSDFRSYPCGYGGLLWEVLVNGNKFIYTPVLISVFILIPMIVVVSNIVTFNISDTKRAIFHSAVLFFLAIGVPTLFQPSVTKTLFSDNYRLIKFMVDDKIKSQCRDHLLIEPCDYFFFEVMNGDPNVLDRALGYLKPDQKPSAIKLLRKLALDDDPIIRQRAEGVLNIMGEPVSQATKETIIDKDREAKQVIRITSDGRRLMGGALQVVPHKLLNRVKTLAGGSGPGAEDDIGVKARFNGPGGITTDGENIYVADILNNTIRKIVIATGEVSTIAGKAGIKGADDGIGTAATFNRPYDVTTDGDYLYVADMFNAIIRRIDTKSGTVKTIAGVAGQCGSVDGIGLNSRFCGPTGITSDGENLYIVDNARNVIRKLVIKTGEVSTIAGISSTQGNFLDGIGRYTRFNSPFGITTDGKNLYVTDTLNFTIRKIALSDYQVSTLAGTPGRVGLDTVDGTGRNARLDEPSGITTDGVNLYVSANSNTLRKVVIETGEVTTIAGEKQEQGFQDGLGSQARFNSPGGLTTDGKHLFLSDGFNNAVRVIE